VLAGDAAVSLTWDPGTTHTGTQVYTHPNTNAGSYWFKINPGAATNGGWRTALNVTAGNANLYLRRSLLPDTNNYDYASTVAGSDGFVLRPDQFNEGEDWYILVQAVAGASWNLVTGNAFVQNLGGLQWTDSDRSSPGAVR
jgi:hypothetical protein